MFLWIISGNTTNKSDYPEDRPLIKENQSESTLLDLSNQSERRESDGNQSDAFLIPPSQPKRRKSESSKSDGSLKGTNQSKRRKSDTNQPDYSGRLISQSKRSKSDIFNFGKKPQPEWWEMSPGIQSQRMKSEKAEVVDRKPNLERKSSSPLDVLIALVSIILFVCTYLWQIPKGDARNTPPVGPFFNSMQSSRKNDQIIGWRHHLWFWRPRVEYPYGPPLHDAPTI